MALWEIAIWAGAATMAFVALVGLMSRYRLQCLQERLAAEQARRQAEANSHKAGAPHATSRGTAA